MMDIMVIENQGLVITQRIVAIGIADSAGARRLLAALPERLVVNLTGGRKRQSLIVLDSGHLVLSALSLDELVQRLDVLL